MRLACTRALFSGKKTVLYDYHVAQKGKMVEFAGMSPLIQVTICPSNTPLASSRNTNTVAIRPVSSMSPTWDKLLYQAPTA